MSDEADRARREERDAFTVVLEDLRSQFKAFGEGQQLLADKVDRLESRFDGLENRFDGLESRFDGLEKKVEVMGADLRSLTRNFRTLNATVDQIDDRLIAVEKRLMNGHARPTTKKPVKRPKKK